MTAIGSVRPVMIVLRHECRNRNTMSTVRSAPSMIVSLTRFTLASTWSACEYTTLTSTSAGRRALSALIASRTPRPVSTMFASCALRMSMVIDGRPLMREIESSSFSPSITSATWER